ncbi:MAG: glycosyltransferase family 2 protein, partial [Phycisphaerae bacterium]
ATDILVIDDGSIDGTARILRSASGVATITHPENRGYGQSVIDAIRYADGCGYDWVVTMDCDEQHEPERIPDFLAAAARDDADVVSGSRYLVSFPGDDEPPAERLRINQSVNTLLDQVLGLRLTDSFCGFKAHRVAAMRQLRLDEPGYAFPLQFWVECMRAELRVCELPVRRIYRDRNRQFGGTLDDPASRMEHYLDVFVQALQRPEDSTTRVECNTCTTCRRG